MMTDVSWHKRLIAPEKIAAAAMWLVRPGSESVNGQATEIAGGQTLIRTPALDGRGVKAIDDHH